MDAAEYDEIRERLRVYAEAALVDFLAAFPYSRLIRIRDNLAWSEEIDGEEIQFEFVVFSPRNDSVHVSMEAIQGGIGGPSYIAGDDIRPEA